MVVDAILILLICMQNDMLLCRLYPKTHVDIEKGVFREKNMWYYRIEIDV